MAPSLIVSGSSLLILAFASIALSHGSIGVRIAIAVLAAILGLGSIAWGVLILRRNPT